MAGGSLFLSGLFEFVLGKTKGWVANWAKDAAVAALTSPAHELEKRLTAATEAWKETLPNEFRGQDFNPRILWNAKLAIDPDDDAERQLAERLWKRDVPSEEEFLDVLRRRVRRLRLGAEAKDLIPARFIRASESVVDAYLQNLAELLREVCITDPALVRTATYRRVEEIEKSVAALRRPAIPQRVADDLRLIQTALPVILKSQARMRAGILGAVHGRAKMALESVFVDPDLHSHTGRASFPRHVFGTLEPLFQGGDWHRNQDGRKRTPLGEVLDSLNSLAREEPAPRLVILGEPGSGKTAVCRRIVRAHADYDELRLPIFLELRNYFRLAQGKGVLEFAAEELTRLGLEVSAGDLQVLCESGRATLVLDGLDEVLNVGDRQRACEMINALALAPAMRRVSIVISSRLVGYKTVTLSDEFEHWEIAPLSNKQQVELAKRWCANVQDHQPAEVERRVRTFTHVLAVDPRIGELARSPLLLIAMLLVQDSGGELPTKRVELLDQCVGVMLDRIPRANGRAFDGRRLRQLSERVLLEHVALIVQERIASRRVANNPPATHAQLNFERSELVSIIADALGCCDPTFSSRRAREQLATSWLTHLVEQTGIVIEPAPGVFSFAHRSFQEYLAACALLDSDESQEKRALALLDRYLLSHEWHHTLVFAIACEWRDERFSNAVAVGLLENFDETKDFGRRLFLLKQILEVLREDIRVNDDVFARSLERTEGFFSELAPQLWQAASGRFVALLKISKRNGERARRWMQKRVRKSRGNSLRWLVLRADERVDVMAALEGREDKKAAVADILSIGPWYHWGLVVRRSADKNTALAWLMHEPLEYGLMRAFECLRTSWSIGAAAVIPLLLRRARWIAETLNGRLEREQQQTGSRQLGKSWSSDTIQGAVIRCPAFSVGSTVGRGAVFTDVVRAGYMMNSLSTEVVAPFDRGASKGNMMAINTLLCTTASVHFQLSSSRMNGQTQRPMEWGDLARHIGASQALLRGELTGEPDENPIQTAKLQRGTLRGGVENLLPMLPVTWSFEAREVAMEAFFGVPDADNVLNEIDDWERFALGRGRAANEWMRQALDNFVEFMGERARMPEYEALLLALGLAAYQTTWRWPHGPWWKRMFSDPLRPPTHWLPECLWHLCWFVDDPTQDEHLVAARAALQRADWPELAALIDAGFPTV